MSEIPLEKENTQNLKSRSFSSLHISTDLFGIKTSLNSSWSSSRDSLKQSLFEKEELEQVIKSISMEPKIVVESDDETDDESVFQPSPFKFSKTHRTSFLSRSVSELPTFRLRDEECDSDTEEEQEISMTPRGTETSSNSLQPRSHSFNVESNKDKFTTLRRSHTSTSLTFERPKPVLNTQPLQKIEIIEDTALPCFKCNSPQYQCIDGKTVCYPKGSGFLIWNFLKILDFILCRLMDGEFADRVERYFIIDCRYDYEYRGGHIRGAMNISDPNYIVERFFSEGIISPNKSYKTTAIIFHCEFSSERGPNMHNFFREHDRDINKYPLLHYPEVYLLQGGYSKFYEKHKEYCDPVGYTTMKDKKYRLELKSMMRKLKEKRPRSISSFVQKSHRRCFSSFSSESLDSQNF